ncbi:MAG TPA: hypothetical protein VHQ70_04970 [Syntrophomonadaceae bacterium]|nr:hypothetical protein [Syntrophomonadaceae bacterium]
MKGYIAFCPHFHQPHFQLWRTREEAYGNSYLPWLEMLQQAVRLDNFYINLHFSGPLLYWLKDQKPAYLEQLNQILATGRAGIVGGLADEPFIQLSSRLDDYYYQLKKYAELCYSITGISADKWQGIHLVERECGELLLHEVTRAAGLIGAPALYYLDAETFYQSHFSYPGGENDYCLKHFNFKDLFSKTTITHIPPDMLYFGLRDEIGGQVFNALPVHTQFRYKLLKRNGFTNEDMARIKPNHYYFYIKDALEKAAEMAQNFGRDLVPLVVIFEDAEKLGQWSKDPEGDTQWLMEFFDLVNRDQEISFIGLKDYIEKVGILDMYPASSSHSYPEWENWTAKRGIRGVTFGDERLRRVMSCLRDIETIQNHLESIVLEQFAGSLTAGLDDELVKVVNRNIIDSPQRFEIVEKLLLNKCSSNARQVYEIVNRVRNVVYQEDPKWASRHPCYGSSPYYDMQGLAYLEIAHRVLQGLIDTVEEKESGPTAVIKDWDFDGIDEVVIKLPEQTLCIDPEGGCISYHHVLAADIACSRAGMLSLLTQDMEDIKAYNTVYRYSYPLVFTETDSDLNLSYYHEGGRREVCRNSCRCRLLTLRDERYQSVGDFEQGIYQIDHVEQTPGKIDVQLSLKRRVDIGKFGSEIVLIKNFVITSGQVSVILKIHTQGNVAGLFLAPQLVTSAAPSDEIHFHPKAFIGFNGCGEYISLRVEDIAQTQEGGFGFRSIDDVIPAPEKVEYIFRVSNQTDNFDNGVIYNFSGQPSLITIKPAVKHYYRDYVFEQQSRLGYHTSGLLVEPLIPLENETQFQVDIRWVFNTKADRGKYRNLYELVED